MKNQQMNRKDDYAGSPVTENSVPKLVQDALKAAGRGEGFFRRFSLFWRFQLAGWIAFSVFSVPVIFWQTGTVSSALFLGFIVNGASFLLTLGLRLVFRLFWPTGNVYLLGIIIVACAFSGVVLIGVLFAVHEMRVVDDAKLFTDSTAFRFFYERTGALFAWSFLYLGIRRALDEIQSETRNLQSVEQHLHDTDA